MANRAYLIANDTSNPAGVLNGEINYDPDTEILAGASYLIPVFGCSLFSLSDIQYYAIDQYRIPAPVVRAVDAKQRFLRRLPLIESAFSYYQTAIDLWRTFIENLTETYIKIDCLEIWDLEPELFESQFLASIRWFDSQDQSDFDQLMDIAAIKYNSDLEEFSLDSDSDDIFGYHLHGYGWVREVPWEEGA